MEKLVQGHYYLKLTMSVLFVFFLHVTIVLYDLFRLFDKAPEFVLDSKQLKTIIVKSLLSLHGQVWVWP